MTDDARRSGDSRPSRLHPASSPPEPRRGAGRREVALEETVRQGDPPLDDGQWHTLLHRGERHLWRRQQLSVVRCATPPVRSALGAPDREPIRHHPSLATEGVMSLVAWFRLPHGLATQWMLRRGGRVSLP